MRNVRNRYPFAYSFIKNQLSNFIDEEKLAKIDKDFKGKDTDEPSDAEQIFFIFLHQCMSYYFGDSDWYSDKSKKDSVSKIISIEHPKENNKPNEKTINVTFKDGSLKGYSTVDETKLEKAVPAVPAPPSK
jgi:hypothetical protein